MRRLPEFKVKPFYKWFDISATSGIGPAELYLTLRKDDFTGLSLNRSHYSHVSTYFIPVDGSYVEIDKCYSTFKRLNTHAFDVQWEGGFITTIIQHPKNYHFDKDGIWEGNT